MKKIAIIAHTVDRQGMLADLLASAKRYKCLDGWDIVLVGQGYDSASIANLRAMPNYNMLTHVYTLPKRIGPHSARMVGLQHQADLYLSLDDDMVFSPETNFVAMEPHALAPGAGVVAASYNPTSLAMVAKMSAKYYADAIVEYRLVCTAGGLMFAPHVADILREMPNLPYLFDDIEWSLATYQRGYCNYVYFGSWAWHKAGRAGGRNGWFDKKSKPLPDSSMLRLRTRDLKNPQLSEDNRVAFPIESDVTKKARDLHKTNREALGFTVDTCK